MNKSYEEKSKFSNFIVQGGILAFTGVLVRILGLAKRVPQAYIIGDIGNSYYSAAYEAYNIAYTIAAYGIPLSVSKLVSARVSKGEYKNAHKVFRCALSFAFIMGLLASLIVFFFSDDFSELLHEPMSSLPLKVLAPTLFVVCIMAVFRGYFQGLGTMVPTAISQLIEQVILISVSLSAAYFLTGYGEKVGRVLHNENYKYAYGAAGTTLGCFAGALIGMIFLVLLYKAHSKQSKKQIYRDTTDVTETTAEVFKILIFTILPVLVSSFVNNLSNIIDLSIYNYAMVLKGLDDIKSVNWGIYSGKYTVLINVPIAISASMGASSVPTISGLIKQKKFELCSSKINSVVRITMMVAIPCAVGMCVLAPSLMWFLFSSTNETGANLLRIGSVGIVLFSFSTLSNSILQGMSKLIKPITHGLIALALHVTILFCLFKFTDWNIYAVPFSNNFFSLFICIMNLYSISKILGYRQEVKRTFLLPLAGSAVMGTVVFFLDKFLCKNGLSRISILFTIFVGILVYLFVLLLTKAVTKEELSRIPGGLKLYAVLKRIHLMN